MGSEILPSRPCKLLTKTIKHCKGIQKLIWNCIHSDDKATSISAAPAPIVMLNLIYSSLLDLLVLPILRSNI